MIKDVPCTRVLKQATFMHFYAWVILIWFDRGMSIVGILKVLEYFITLSLW